MSESHLSVLSDSLRPHGLYSPRNSPAQNTGVGSLSPLQGLFPTQDRTQVSRIAGEFFQLSHKGSPCIYSVQFSSVQSLSRVQLCDPMNLSTPGLPVHHQLLEFIQTHVQQVGDAIQPSHPLSSPSPPAPNPSQHQGLFQ